MGTFETYQERPGDPEEHIHEKELGQKEKEERKKQLGPQSAC